VHPYRRQIEQDEQPLRSAVVVQQFYEISYRPFGKRLAQLHQAIFRLKHAYPDGYDSVPEAERAQLIRRHMQAIQEVLDNAGHLERWCLGMLLAEPTHLGKEYCVARLCLCHLVDVTAQEMLAGNPVSGGMSRVQRIISANGDPQTETEMCAVLDRLWAAPSEIDALAKAAPRILQAYYMRTRILAN